MYLLCKNKQGRIERNTNGSIGLHNLCKPICYFNTLYDNDRKVVPHNNGFCNVYD